jgi:transposase
VTTDSTVGRASGFELASPGAQATLLDYLGAIDTPELRRSTREMTISELVVASPYDVTRSDRAGKLMSHIGLVPSDNRTGESRRQGPITKTGSRHARRLLVEAASTTARPPPAASPCNAAKTDSRGGLLAYPLTTVPP